jgi:hypothetical protein
MTSPSVPFHEAQEIVAQMNEPLTAAQKHMCAISGVSEEAFRAERNEEMGRQLNVNAGLTADELHVAKLMGLTPQQFAQARAEETR